MSMTWRGIGPTETLVVDVRDAEESMVASVEEATDEGTEENDVEAAVD